MPGTSKPDPCTIFRLDGKVAIVTGASSGIGLRMAQALDAAGATVILAARRFERLDAAAKEMQRATAVRCDITREADLDRLVRLAADAGGPDVLVNNAGYTSTHTADTQSSAEFRESLEVNLVSHFRLAQLAASRMKSKGGGSIINIVSILGLVGGGRLGTEPSYSASKGAMVSLTRELAAQWARQGTRVNAIAPGWFPTEMTDQLLAAHRGRSWIERNTPMGRPGRLDELDGAVLFLASDASSFVTGQVIAVDGGWTAV